jgi:hypothetical protein
MTIQELGALGEFLGSIFVLVTLIYLAVQVRQSRDLLEENRKIALSQVYEGRSAYRGGLTRDLMNNQHWISTFLKLRGGLDQPTPDVLIENYEKLTDQEKLLVTYRTAAMIQGIDNSLYQIGLGLVDEDGASGSYDFIRSEYPLWVHAGVSIPPRISRWYEENAKVDSMLDEGLTEEKSQSDA